MMTNKGKNNEKIKSKDNNCKRKHKHFFMPILENKIGEINTPNFISL